MIKKVTSYYLNLEIKHSFCIVMQNQDWKEGIDGKVFDICNISYNIFLKIQHSIFEID